MDEVEKALQHNAEHLAERGPALSYAYKSPVFARRPSTGEVLIGGLGAMGIGQMWVTEEERHREYPGYADAKIVD